MTKDLLVVLTRGADPASLGTEFAVSQAASDRVFILSVPDSTSESDVASRPGVEVATGHQVSAESLDLTDSEALFVAAWTQRLEDRFKTRPSDGEDWDTPGRLPPDPPKPV